MSHGNKYNIFGILRSNWFRNIFFEDANSKIWPYVTRSWPDPSLYLTCVESVFRLQNGSDFLIKREKVTINHVSYPWKRIFYSGDLSWPDLDLYPYLERHLFSQGIFNNPWRLLWLSFEQKLSILPALGFIIQKRQKLNFDLTLTRDLRSVLKS